MQASYLTEPHNPTTLAISSVLSTRSVLSAYSPTLTHYPHNSTILFPLLYLPISALPSHSLASLSLLHRRALISSSTPSYIHATHSLLLTRGGNGLPTALPNLSNWIFTNQQVAKLPEVEFGLGSRLRGFFVWSLPDEGDNATRVQRVDGGYFLSTRMRGGRWRSVEGELERMREGRGRRVV